MTLADELDQAVLECDALALAMERVGLDPEDGTEGAMFSAFARGRPPAERLEALRAGYVRLRDRVYEAHGRIPPDDTPPVRTVRVVEVRRATADGDDGPADAPAPRPLRPPFNACGHCKGIGHNRSTCPKAPPRTGPGRIKLGRQVQAPREPRGERGAGTSRIAARDVRKLATTPRRARRSRVRRRSRVWRRCKRG